MTTTEPAVAPDVYQVLELFLDRLTEVKMPTAIAQALEDVESIAKEVGPRLARAREALHTHDEAQRHILGDLETRLGFKADIDDALFGMLLELSGASRLHAALLALASSCDPDSRDEDR